QMALLLKVVRQAIGADIVLCSSGAEIEPILSIGNDKLPANWCESFAGRVLQAVSDPSSDLVYLTGDRLPQARPGDPCSVLMMRLSKSRSLWVMALRFSATRPFTASEGKALSL